MEWTPIDVSELLQCFSADAVPEVYAAMKVWSNGMHESVAWEREGAHVAPNARIRPRGTFAETGCYELLCAAGKECGESFWDDSYAVANERAFGLSADAKQALFGGNDDSKTGACGVQFEAGDRIWRCATCGIDATCVQCNACFQASRHAGHATSFSIASDVNSGCCDCGDAEAWKRDVCCSLHAAAPAFTREALLEAAALQDEQRGRTGADAPLPETDAAGEPRNARSCVEWEATLKPAHVRRRLRVLVQLLCNASRLVPSKQPQFPFPEPTETASVPSSQPERAMAASAAWTGSPAEIFTGSRESVPVFRYAHPPADALNSTERKVADRLVAERTRFRATRGVCLLLWNDESHNFEQVTRALRRAFPRVRHEATFMKIAQRIDEIGWTIVAYHPGAVPTTFDAAVDAMAEIGLHMTLAPLDDALFSLVVAQQWVEELCGSLQQGQQRLHEVGHAVSGGEHAVLAQLLVASLYAPKRLRTGVRRALTALSARSAYKLPLALAFRDAYPAVAAAHAGEREPECTPWELTVQCWGTPSVARAGGMSILRAATRLWEALLALPPGDRVSRLVRRVANDAVYVLRVLEVEGGGQRELLAAVQPVLLWAESVVPPARAVDAHVEFEGGDWQHALQGVECAFRLLGPLARCLRRRRCEVNVDVGVPFYVFSASAVLWRPLRYAVGAASLRDGAAEVRAVRFLSEVRAGLWVRNGRPVQVMAALYREGMQRVPPFERDLRRLRQALAGAGNKADFLGACASEFGLTDQFLVDVETLPRMDFAQRRSPQSYLALMRDFLMLVLSMLEPADAGGEGGTGEAVERRVLAALFAGPQTFSRLCGILDENDDDDDDDGEDAEEESGGAHVRAALARVAEFRAPRSFRDRGSYVASAAAVAERWDPFSREYWLATRDALGRCEEHVRSRDPHATRKFWARLRPLEFGGDGASSSLLQSHLKELAARCVDRTLQLLQQDEGQQAELVGSRAVDTLAYFLRRTGLQDEHELLRAFLRRAGRAELADALQSSNADSNGEDSKENDRRERARVARARVVAQMAQQSAQFAAKNEEEDDASDDAASDEATQDAGLTCVFCQAGVAGLSGGHLALVAESANARMETRLPGKSPLETEVELTTDSKEASGTEINSKPINSNSTTEMNADSASLLQQDAPSREPWCLRPAIVDCAAGAVHYAAPTVDACGHSMHFTCWKQLLGGARWATAVLRPLREGCTWCPLCHALCNVVLPAAPFYADAAVTSGSSSSTEPVWATLQLSELLQPAAAFGACHRVPDGQQPWQQRAATLKLLDGYLRAFGAQCREACRRAASLSSGSDGSELAADTTPLGAGQQGDADAVLGVAVGKLLALDAKGSVDARDRSAIASLVLISECFIRGGGDGPYVGRRWPAETPQLAFAGDAVCAVARAAPPLDWARLALMHVARIVQLGGGEGADLRFMDACVRSYLPLPAATRAAVFGARLEDWGPRCVQLAAELQQHCLDSGSNIFEKDSFAAAARALLTDNRARPAATELLSGDGIGNGRAREGQWLRVSGGRHGLVELPPTYDELLSAVAGRACGNCGTVPPQASVCLQCGEIVCAFAICCRRSAAADAEDEGVTHAKRHGGVAMLLMVAQCVVYVFCGAQHFNVGAPYLDEHGEEDVHLSRGRPLFLHAPRVAHLQAMLLGNGVAHAIARRLAAEVTTQLAEAGIPLTNNNLTQTNIALEWQDDGMDHDEDEDEEMDEEMDDDDDEDDEDEDDEDDVDDEEEDFDDAEAQAAQLGLRNVDRMALAAGGRAQLVTGGNNGNARAVARDNDGRDVNFSDIGDSTDETADEISGAESDGDGNSDYSATDLYHYAIPDNDRPETGDYE